jgi:hypothetical protein
MGAENWDDPYDLVPEAFKNTHPEADSVRDALRKAGRLPSSTPPEDRRGTCPECGSVGISPIGTGQGEGSANDWKCNECENRFTEPNEPDMNQYDHTAHYRFQFLDEDDLVDPDRRTALDPPLADLDREELVEAVIRLYRPWSDDGPALADIARFVPYERYWVGERNREWEDGDHRDLVADPTADDATPDDATPSVDATLEEPTPDEGPEPAVADGGRGTRRWAAYGSD